MYSSAFGGIAKDRQRLESDKVEIAFVQTTNVLIELLAPLAEEGPIATFLQKKGGGLHHICYQVQDIKGELERLAEEGFQLIDSEPREGALGKQIAFIHPKSTGGVLIELCQNC